MGDINAYKIFDNLNNRLLWILRCKWKDNIKMDL